MNAPPFERAIVVTFDEVKTLLRTIDNERRRLQEARQYGSHDLNNLFSVEKRLQEVQKHMETDETIWNEHMKEYEESAY